MAPWHILLRVPKQIRGGGGGDGVVRLHMRRRRRLAQRQAFNKRARLTARGVGRRSLMGGWLFGRYDYETNEISRGLNMLCSFLLFSVNMFV